MQYNMAGKTRASNKKSKVRKSHAPKNKEVSVDELLAAAEAAMTSLDVEKAIPFYSKAASLLRKGRSSTSETRERDLIQVLEKMGESKVSVGDQEGARKDFKEALEVLDQEEDKNVSYYETRSNISFYVGQLCMEHEALETYQQGVKSLESCLDLVQKASAQNMVDDDNQTNQNQKLLPELRRKLSGAYCTIAELYLTDLCYEDNAETECEAHLEKALQIKDTNGEPLVDALQTMASLRLSQQSRRVEAITYILRAYDKMKVGSEALAALVGLAEPDDDDTGKEDQAAELKEVDAANNMPEFEFRCQTAKLLLECTALLKESRQDSEPSQPQEDQCVSAAISVLGSLLAQNDEVIEVWFLTGCAFASKTPPLVDPARFYFQRAMEMLVDTKKALEQEAQWADEDEKQEIQEQLDENQTQLEDVQAKLDELEAIDESSKMDE